MTLPSAQLTPSSAPPENPLHILEVTSPFPKSTLTGTTAGPHNNLIPPHWFFTNSSSPHNISPWPILILAGPCLVGSCVPTAAAILGFGHPPITLTHHHPLVCSLSTHPGETPGIHHLLLPPNLQLVFCRGTRIEERMGCQWQGGTLVDRFSSLLPPPHWGRGIPPSSPHW